ncbi:MAG: pyridoxamine 5'-phosphate oxidase family protein [Proteobacteria bacterium]|nr:pyridoxamine 5'-phosphate oxidase family protein [Pseudomonadota bacterium]MDA0942280.1 pyridoxamine 5'-phosphate oxidase family protein [Pseudomonadota bacterium]
MQLSDFINQALKNIQRATVDRKSKFRFPVLASTNAHSVSQRIVVARKFNEDQKSLIIFTDEKSQKFAELKINANCSLLFWDAGKKMQVSVVGLAQILSRDDALQYWQNLSDIQKKDYQINPAPKSTIEAHNLYEFDSSMNRFAVIEILFQNLDILVLSNNGHQRANYNIKSLEQSWVTP